MQHFSPIKQRILEYLEFKGVSMYQFNKDSGVTRGVIEKNTGISEENISKFLVYAPEVDVNWLVLGTGKMLKTYDSDEEISRFVNEPDNVFKLKTDRNVKNQLIPLYDIVASAGIVELLNSKTLTQAKDYINIPNLPKSDGALYIKGDSMYPLLKSGDIVIYKKVNNIMDNIFWGEMYLVSLDVDGEEYNSVKYIQKSDKGDEYIKLVSQNSHHHDKDIHLSRVMALAIIKASIRINGMR